MNTCSFGSQTQYCNTCRIGCYYHKQSNFCRSVWNRIVNAPCIGVLICCCCILCLQGCNKTPYKQNYQNYRYGQTVATTTDATTASSIKIEQYIPYHDTLKKIKSYLFPSPFLVHHQVIGTAIKRIIPAVVSIGAFERGVGGVRMVSIATGVCISPDGDIFTCADMVQGIKEVTVTFFDKKQYHQYRGYVYAIDNMTNAALIKIYRSKQLKMPFVAIDNPNTVAAGDWIFAVSCMEGFSTMTVPGVVSATGCSRKVNGRIYRNSIVADIKSKQIHAGSPVFDNQGNCIGFTTVKGIIVPAEETSPLYAYIGGRQ